MNLPQTLTEVFSEAEKAKLYNDLIRQFNKDFRRANVDAELPEESTPEELLNALAQMVATLMEQGGTTYQNLLYAVDIPDYQAVKIGCLEDFLYMIVRREWQKVWFRYKYSPK